MEEHERSDAEFVTTKLGDVMSRNFSGEPHAQLRRAFVYKESHRTHRPTSLGTEPIPIRSRA